MTYHIMIVEDDYWAAMALALEVEDRGATVTGPLSSVSHAVGLLQGDQRPNVAILDVNIGDGEVFPLADILVRIGIPFVFATGYERDVLPKRFARVPHFEKPLSGPNCIDTALALAEERHAQPQPL